MTDSSPMRFLHCRAHGILADGVLHAEESRIDAVATDAVDMGIAPVSCQDAQEDGAHDVDGSAAAIAGVVQGTAAEELLPAPSDVKKLKEEDELPLTGDGGVRIPLGEKSSAGCVQGPGTEGEFGSVLALTRRVSAL